jgi:hypothetical protein
MKPDKKMQNEWIKKILPEDRDPMESIGRYGKYSVNSRKRSFFSEIWQEEVDLRFYGL